MKIKNIALAAALALSLGCATLLDVGRDVCDTALGGSKLGDAACAKIADLRSEEAEVAE